VSENSLLRKMGYAALLSTAYYAGTRLGFLMTPPQQAISVFWPPNAILLAALLLSPVQFWWVLLLAVLPAHLLADLPNGIPVSTALGWFLSNTAEALIGAACIRRFARRESLFATFHGLVVFLFFGVLLAPMATSLMDAAVVVTTGAGRGYWTLAIARMFSNMLAELTLVPMIVIFVQGGRDWLLHVGRTRRMEAGLLALGVILASVLVFGGQNVSPNNIPALVYIPLPLLLWASLRFGLGGLSTSLLGVALISTWSGMHGRGPFNAPSMMENVLSLKVLLCVVAVPLMLLAAVISDRQRVEQMLRGVSGKLIEAQEQERQRIGRDLHDDIGQRLSVVAIELQQTTDDLPDSAFELRRRMDRLYRQASEIANDVQILSHELHSAKLEYLGIIGAMRGFCVEFAEQRRVEIDFGSHDLPSPLPSREVSLCLFRVLQEALHNASKHSGIRHFEVMLWGRNGEIHLTVSDSGAGFDPDAALKGPGLGLTSMKERARLVGGTVSIESKPMVGTLIHICVPLSADNYSERAAG
jgi:signal transduction histidine kinase